MTDAQFTAVSHALRDGLIPPGEVAVAVRSMMDEVRDLRVRINRARSSLDVPAGMGMVAPALRDVDDHHRRWQVKDS